MCALEANCAARWVSRCIEACLKNGRPWQSLISDESLPSRAMPTIAWLVGISDVRSQPCSADFAVASTRVNSFPYGKTLSTGEGTIAVVSPHCARPFPSHPLHAILLGPGRSCAIDGSKAAPTRALHQRHQTTAPESPETRWCANQASGGDAARRRRSITATPSPSSDTPSTMITSTPCASSFRKAAKS
jgi:hypothetical protein